MVLFEGNLVTPFQKGSETLSVVSGYASATMAHKHFQRIKQVAPSKISEFRIELLVGMCLEDGISRSDHEGFLGLCAGPYKDQFTCRYVVSGKPVDTKLYVWMSKGAPSKAFTGSANYSQSAFSPESHETLVACDPEASKVSGAFGTLTPFHVSGKYSTGERTAIIERFMDVEPSLVTNARCLTEGVDVPAIDAVLFADPKQSKIDIVQAAGRALRMADKKAFGYILLPIVIEDDVADLSHAAFAQIISVLSALGMHDERIVEEFKTLVSGTRDHKNIVEFNLPNTSTSINFDDFISNIEILVWDRLSFAKSVIGETNFTKWMRENTNLSEKSLKNYSQAIRKISNDLVRLKLTYSSLEELMQSEDLYTLKKEYFDIPEYRALDERGKGMYSAGFNKLIEYHQAKNS